MNNIRTEIKYLADNLLNMKSKVPEFADFCFYGGNTILALYHKGEGNFDVSLTIDGDRLDMSKDERAFLVSEYKKYKERKDVRDEFHNNHLLENMDLGF